MAEPHAFDWLAGVWSGTGEGSYPTIETFTYTEDLTIEPVPGRPAPHSRSRTRDPASGQPPTAQYGYPRHNPARVETRLATASGLIATHTGHPTHLVLLHHTPR